MVIPFCLIVRINITRNCVTSQIPSPLSLGAWPPRTDNKLLYMLTITDLKCSRIPLKGVVRLAASWNNAVKKWFKIDQTRDGKFLDLHADRELHEVCLKFYLSVLLLTIKMPGQFHILISYASFNKKIKHKLMWRELYAKYAYYTEALCIS